MEEMIKAMDGCHVPIIGMPPIHPELRQEITRMQDEAFTKYCEFIGKCISHLPYEIKMERLIEMFLDDCKRTIEQQKT